MIDRPKYVSEIDLEFQVHPVCAILGPRQVGKTTLAKAYAKERFPEDHIFFDLESSDDLEKLEDPLFTLSRVTQRLVVIDEVQNIPDLFVTLRVLADRFGTTKQFLILGSASPELLKQSSESLAGRIGYLELPPFSLFEVGEVDKLWFRGGFPRSYLSTSDLLSLRWRKNFIKTFLGVDVPALGFKIPVKQLKTFWTMLAHYHGQIFNASEIGRTLGQSDQTVKKYLDILEGTYMVRVLQPWYENLGKRQVKSPKIYFRDSGMLNALTSLNNKSQFEHFPKLGAYWEGFALEEVIRVLQVDSQDCYFWATHTEAELDLLTLIGTSRIGFEFKYASVPKITKSMRIALEDLNLDHLAVVCLGKEIYPIVPGISVYGIETIASGKFLEVLQTTNLNPHKKIGE